MLEKSISQTVSAHSTRRHSHVSLSYWVSTVLIIFSTVIHGIFFFTSTTWLIVNEPTNKSSVVRFRSEDICLEQGHRKLFLAPYLSADRCNATDLFHWLSSCSREHLTLFNQSSPGPCHCHRIPWTKLIRRHSPLIGSLLLFASLISLAKLCSAEECLLRYVHRHLLSILLVCVLVLEFHLVYVVFKDKRWLEKLLRMYFPVHDLYFGWFYSFRLVSILNHTTLIVILLSCS